MAHYCSIKGWIDTRFEDVPALEQQIHHYWCEASVAEPSQERRDMYYQAWHFPKPSSNWSAYTFLGLDFQQQYLEWLQTGLMALLNLPFEITAYFEITNEEFDDVTTVWQIHHGTFEESQK